MVVSVDNQIRFEAFRHIYFFFKFMSPLRGFCALTSISCFWIFFSSFNVIKLLINSWRHWAWTLYNNKQRRWQSTIEIKSTVCDWRVVGGEGGQKWLETRIVIRTSEISMINVANFSTTFFVYHYNIHQSSYFVPVIASNSKWPEL